MILSLIASAAISASCAWDNPRGTYAVTAVKPSALVDNYQDIPAPVRQRIKDRMDALKYDEVAEIRRTSIRGEYAYSDLRDMHFGASGGKVCREVSLTNWRPDETERALVYCEDGHCIAVPTVCRNVSRITRGARLTPPVPLALDVPPAYVDPLPVSVLAPIPDVEPGTLADDYIPQTFARVTDVPDVSDVPWDRYDRISTDLSFWEGWSRPPLWGEPAIVVRVAQVPSVDLPKDTGGAVDSVAPIPEPGTYALMVFGLVGVWWMTRGQKRVIGSGGNKCLS